MIKKINKSPILKYGIVIIILLIFYFLLLSYYDKHTNFALSFINSIIIGFGIYKAINALKIDKGNRYSTSDGFKVGIFTGCFATTVHAIFFSIYIYKVDVKFATKFLNVSFKPVSLDTQYDVFRAEFLELITSFIDFEMPGIVSLLGLLIVVIFGCSTSIILTYIFVNYLD